MPFTECYHRSWATIFLIQFWRKICVTSPTSSVPLNNAEFFEQVLFQSFPIARPQKMDDSIIRFVDDWNTELSFVCLRGFGVHFYATTWRWWIPCSGAERNSHRLICCNFISIMEP